MQLLDREHERSALDALIAAAGRGDGGALVLCGAPGVGLSALVEHAVAGASGERVVRIHGARSERDIAFAALHQLCAPLLPLLDDLPARQRQCLATTFGLSDADAGDPLLIGLAVLALLSKAAEERPLICAIDDAQWLDAPSAQTLAFVARRVNGERVALVIATHVPASGTPFAGLDERLVGGLAPDACRALLAPAVAGPLDGRVRDRLVADLGGNPLALLDVAAQLTPEQLAGLSGLPPMLPLGDRLADKLLSAIADMPRETRQLLLLVAMEPQGTASSLWAAAASLGLSADAAAPAEAAGVLRIGQRMAFRDPLLGLAVYERATAAERQRAHRALVAALDHPADRDRRAWHLAAASLTPDEAVAAELEAAAERAKGRRDHPAAVALFERAAGLTPDAEQRYIRMLAAAQSALAAGTLERAAWLLDRGSPAPLDAPRRAQAQRLRGAIGLASGGGADRPTVLLRAARALEPLDVRLARESYLEALEAAIGAGRLGGDRALREAAEAARSAPHAPQDPPSAADLLLDGLAALIADGPSDAVPTIRRAFAALLAGDEPRWLPLGVLSAFETWDDEALHQLTSRQLELRPTSDLAAGLASAVDPLGDLDVVVAGRFGSAMTPAPDARPRPVRPAEVIGAAWRGRPTEARDLAEECMRAGFAGERGLDVAFAHLAIAVLEVGLGQYEAALTAARAAGDAAGPGLLAPALAEVIEAAVRAGEREVAITAVTQLAGRAAASATEWGLGTLARSRALVEDGASAAALYREAIERLRSSRAAPHLARAHLVYGEWLRRERRRREAREQLRTARDMFIFMGAHAFAERARVELTATGEHARRRVADAPADLLTAQEARIARLVCEGATNAAIGTQLFISPRTVEYHLHKAFRKLGVSSRTQLARVMLDADTPVDGEDPSA